LDHDRIRLVLNEVSPELEVRPAAVEEALGLSLFWSIPHDRALRRSGQLGEAVTEAHPNSRAARRISDLARVLSGVPVGDRGRGRQGFLGRLLSRRNGKQAPVEDAIVKEETKT
jgi:Flp pilus assembly CpaE family ATPase